MRKISYFLSTFLALSGLTFGVMGIALDSYKGAAVGILLIFGAGVFATLYLGSRRNDSLPG